MVYDYIVVGAGSSGCACAARLANLLPDVKIALIESGEDYMASPASEEFTDPKRYSNAWHGQANMGYRTVPQTALNNRQLSLFRASAVGGCSVINVMIWMRGFKEDWDKHMPEGFKGRDVEREFEWLEERIKPISYEGNFLGEKTVQAAESLGYKKTAASLWETPGITSTTRIALDAEGNRQDVYRALGADDSSRITLLRGTVEKVIFDQSTQGKIRATGVMLRSKDGSTEDICTNQNGEIILSCGSIDTPKLLQLSGVGPKRLLNDLDITLVLDSPVGEGLKDHVMYLISHETPTLPEKLSPNGINAVLYDESLDVQYLIFDGGSTPFHVKHALLEPCHEKMPATTMIGNIKDFLDFSVMIVVTFILRMLMSVPSVRIKIQSSYSIFVNLMKPFSTGSVMIRSKNPMDPPLIDPALLNDERDMDTLLKGIDKARSLVKTPPLLNEVVGKETIITKGTDEKDKVRKGANCYHHSTGTCSSCLDGQLRFNGIEGLRVADASSLPFHPRVPTNASSMAVGARCASFIASSRDVD